MKILRLGKNGMVRSQNGTWYNAKHINSFELHGAGEEYYIWGICMMGQDPILGKFKTKEEAQAELDSLFTDETNHALEKEKQR